MREPWVILPVMPMKSASTSRSTSSTHSSQIVTCQFSGTIAATVVTARSAIPWAGGSPKWAKASAPK